MIFLTMYWPSKVKLLIVWSKTSDGESIKVLENNTFIINNESYYIVFEDDKTPKPILRNKEMKLHLVQ